MLSENYRMRICRHAVLIVLVSLASCEIHVKEHWDGGFLADVILHFPQGVHGGWHAHLVFDKPVTSLHIWDGVVVSKLNNGLEYIIMNKNYNKDVHAHNTLTMEIDCKSHGSIPPHGTVCIEEIDNCGGSHGTTGNGQPVVTTHGPHGTTGHGQAAVTTHTPPHGQSGTSGTGTYDYGKLLELSILFYEAQRSGKLPSNNRVPWRGDSAVHDHGDRGEDLSGGWYDAGDYVKFNFPLAYSTTTLLWGLIRWQNAYQTSGQLEYMYECVKWPLDYLLKCWEPTRQEFYVQVGNAVLDHNFWGRPEDMKMARPAYKVTASHPGSDVAGLSAAAMAAGSIAFKTKDHAYSMQLLNSAKSLYLFAKTHTGKYTNSVPEAKEYYESSSYEDDLAFAAAWLYKATNEHAYLQDAEHFCPTDTAYAYGWDDKDIGAQLLLYEITKKAKYSDLVTHFMHDWMPGGDVTYTPCGLAWRSEWGCLADAAGSAMIALMAAEDGLHANRYRKWAMSQLNYILGENNYGLSYVIGFGNKYPLRPHHAASSCPNPPETCNQDAFTRTAPNPHILYGGVVGGPDKHDHWRDDRSDYVHNEVACDYNAAFQSAIAGLKSLSDSGHLPHPDPPSCHHR